MDVKPDIIAWLLKQQDWFQELAERLIQQGGLTADDLQQVVALLKTPQGQKKTVHRTFPGLASADQGAGTLRISRIEAVKGIENLAPRLPLDFGTGNLTVIYGHNGSGKSSYTRVLKRISGKPRAAQLKSNVFHPLPPERSCHIKWVANGIADEADWSPDSAAIDVLKGIDIFDTDEAQHYLTQESAATYIPGVVGLFEQLAQYLKQVRDKLSSEQSQLVSKLPGLPAVYQHCRSAAIYRALSTATVENIAAMTSWSEADEQVLSALNERLSVQDPAESARNKLAVKTSVIQIISKLEQTAQAFSQAAIDGIRALRVDAISKRAVALDSERVKNGLLEGIGSPVWRAMWEAAREYSQQPYPDKAFPVTDEARCILCHQELSAEARQRLNELEAFVQSRLEVDAASAERLYAQALSGLNIPPTAVEIATLCAGAAIQEEWNQYLTGIWNAASISYRALTEHEASQNAVPLADLTDAITKLCVYRDRLQGEAEQFQKDAAGFDRAKALQDKNEAEARRWLSSQAAAIKAEIERLRKISEFDAWISLAGSRALSTKSAEITQKVVTEAYAARFNSELNVLGAPSLQVELVKIRTENAKVLHQLQLKGAQRDKLHNVLSEGERRVISLAAFLADVSDRPGSAPFIFDDPISSLDHEFEWHVAKRLVELAKSRQVIILTHRLSLYGVIEDLAKKEGEPWKKLHHKSICIESFDGAAGHPADQEVWNANTKTANNILLTRLDTAYEAGKEHGAMAYRGLSQGVCSDFRKLIERSVEEDLFNGVVIRHRRGIQTEGRLPFVQDISTEDCKLIEGLMTKYSCYEHSQSTEMPAFIPEYNELKDDISKLKDWREKLKTRRTSNK
ncbi:AAA family ATPase [Pectobacterium brasiliense]|uniref:Restriction endonuclease n=2 Tax=Pectobacteriaceae TaxID=1903410 RepID=A0ABR4VNX4_9GAMM|nr:restriction endonuclease [Pectobacterium versatile]KGA40958.1 restriction endonuclease [Pectobacterium odoriferum]MBA0216608.1 AAA family ATPase [Pectobacterium brasiliense]